MKIVCKNCKTDFDGGKRRQYCSRNCSAIVTNSSEARKQELSEKSKLYWNTHDIELQERSKKIKESWTEEHRKNQSERMIQKWSNPDAKLKNSIGAKTMWQDKAYKEHMRSVAIEMWKNSETRKILTEKRKTVWMNAEYKKMMCNKAQQSWTSERKLSHQTMMINKWKDINWVINRITKTHGIYKDYILPSGKIVKLQGYEPKALTELLTIYRENDIIIGVKDINGNIGKINYMYENIEHRYYPDFYIKSTNTIIEVKSQWTYDKWKEKNELKKMACLKAGFDFKFIIL